MFQYAAGRALSLDRGVQLRLDVSDFAGYGLHQGFELSRVFSCRVDLAEPEDVYAVLGWQSSKRVRRIVARPELRFLRSPRFVVEPHFHHWPEISYAPQDCYLFGYWQSEKYFQTHAAEIRADFAFKPPLTNRNSELVGQIAQVNAVSLHVRRGDYVSNSKTHATHGVCSLDYYRDAIRHISDRVERPYFFIFSDNMAWVKGNLKMDMPHQYIDHNKGAESYNDMRLMSLCRHHIIANSSFSWWGAWLNPNPDKIVVAPRRWFANDTNVADLFPAAWVIL
jgi:hypothetical protein